MAYLSLHPAQDVDEAFCTSGLENDAPLATEGDIYHMGEPHLINHKKCLIYQQAVLASHAPTSKQKLQNKNPGYYLTRFKGNSETNFL